MAYISVSKYYGNLLNVLGKCSDSSSSTVLLYSVQWTKTKNCRIFFFFSSFTKHFQLFFFGNYSDDANGRLMSFLNIHSQGFQLWYRRKKLTKKKNWPMNQLKLVFTIYMSNLQMENHQWKFTKIRCVCMYSGQFDKIVFINHWALHLIYPKIKPISNYMSAYNNHNKKKYQPKRTEKWFEHKES